MLNRAILIGRLVADPELRVTPSGVSVATFRIAIDRAYSAKGGERQADFLSIVAWRNQAEFVSKYFKKGSDICIEGSIQTRDYTDKDGNKRYVTEIVADNVRFVGRKSSNDTGSQDYGYPSPPPEQRTQPAAPSYSSGSAGDFQAIDSDDDLPF